MQVVFRNLLVVTFLVWGASCALNDQGLGGTDAQGGSRADGGMLAGAAGAAGTTSPSGGGGTGGIPTAGTTGNAAGEGGGAGTGAAGTSSVGGAGGDSLNNGGAGTVGTGGAGGTSGGAGSSVAGTSGTAGTGAAGTGAAGTGAAGTGSAGTGAAGTGAAGTGAAGTGPLGQVGCADGTREGYLDRAKYPKIAACFGGWEERGLVDPDTRVPQCDRRAGNTGDRTDGHGCSVADLCAVGWRVCESAKAVAALAPSCADAVAPFGSADVFFVTRQRATESVCEDGPQAGTNNLWGCGTSGIGGAADKSCAPFTRTLRDSECTFPWACAEGPLGTSQNEQGVVNKRGSNGGGVLCCKDGP